MQEEKKFNVGDKVTYKNRDDCSGQYYHFGGDDQGGYVGTISCYNGYHEEFKCWGIEVSTNDDETYSMLECEFVEHDSPQLAKDPYNGFKIGDSVKTYKFEETPDLAFAEAMYKNCGEVGVISAFHMEESGPQAYVHGWYWPIRCIVLEKGVEGVEDVSTLLSKFKVGDTVNTNTKGYQYTNMGSNAHDSNYTWKVIAEECNYPSSDQSNVIIKDKVFSKCQNKWWYQFDKFGNWVSECGLEAIGKPVDPLEAILKEAIRKYPIGTKIRSLHSDGSSFLSESEVIRTPRIIGDGIEGSAGYLYKEGNWAEILTDSSNPCGEIPLFTSGSINCTGNSAFSLASTGSALLSTSGTYHSGIYHSDMYNSNPVQLGVNTVDNVPHQEPKILRHKQKKRKLVIVNQ